MRGTSSSQRVPRAMTFAIAATPCETDCMARKPNSGVFSDQLRAAIRSSSMSQLAIGRAAEVDQAPLSRFVNGKAGLRLDAIDRIIDVLELELVPRGAGTRSKR